MGKPARIVLGLALASLVFAWPGPAESQSNSGRYHAVLTKLGGAYVRDSDWKYNSEFNAGPSSHYSPSSFASHATNATTSYFSALSYRIQANLSIQDASNNAVTNPALTLEAWIDTAKGRLYGYLQQPTAGKFIALFDTDGSNNPDPNGQWGWPLSPGLQTLHVNILRSDPTQTLVEGSSDLRFYYERADPHVTVADLGPDHEQFVPDSMFRIFNDIGYGNYTHFIDRAIASDKMLSFEYAFHKAAVPVRLASFIAERAVCSPGSTACAPVSNPTPGVPTFPFVSDNDQFRRLVAASNTLVTIHGKEVATNSTDKNGLVRFSVKAGDLLGGYPGGRSFSNALVVVAAYTNPNTNESAFAAATETVLPISGNRHSISGLKVNNMERFEDARNDTGTPALAELARRALSLRVTAFDENGGSTQGDAFAVIQGTTGSPIVSKATIGRDNPSPTFSNYRAGTLPVTTIQENHVSRYRVYALFYTSAEGTPPQHLQDVFHGIAFADRGYEVAFNNPVFRTSGTGHLWVNLTSVTTNHDAIVGEPELATRVLVRVTSPDRSPKIEDQAVDLAEAGRGSLMFPISAGQPTTIEMIVALTSGDTLPEPETIKATVLEPATKKRLAGRIPAPEAGLVLLTLAAAVFLAVSRRP